MFDAVRPCVTMINLMSFIWFVAIQYFRFSDTGRACSGDFLSEAVVKFTFSEDESKNDLPSYILRDQGSWFFLYIVLQYLVYLISKIITTVIYNKLRAEFDETKAKVNVGF